MSIWRRFSCWISKATSAQAHSRACKPTTPQTHTQARTSTQSPTCAYTFAEMCHTFSFPRHQWFREHALMLCYTHIACLTK